MHQILSYFIILIYFSSLVVTQRRHLPHHPHQDQGHLTDLPENAEVSYENGTSYIVYDNQHKEHVMGVSDEKCDNAKVDFLN